MKIIYPFPNLNSTAVEVWNGQVISSHTLLSMWLLIHAGFKSNHVSKRGPRSPVFSYQWCRMVTGPQWDKLNCHNETRLCKEMRLCIPWTILSARKIITIAHFFLAGILGCFVMRNSRDHSGYRLSQWEMTLQCNIISHWLSPYPKSWQDS